MPDSRLSLTDRSPLTDRERELIRAAEERLWDDWLRAQLVLAVERRGLRVGSWDNCGDLVASLELAARRP